MLIETISIQLWGVQCWPLPTQNQRRTQQATSGSTTHNWFSITEATTSWILMVLAGAPFLPSVVLKCSKMETPWTTQDWLVPHPQMPGRPKSIMVNPVICVRAKRYHQTLGSIPPKTTGLQQRRRYWRGSDACTQRGGMASSWMVFGWSCWDIRGFFVSSFDPFQKQLAAPNEVHLAHDLLRRYDVHCSILDWRGHRLSATPLQELQEWGTNWWSIKPPSAEELQSLPTASMFDCTMIFELDHVKFSGGESMGWVNLRC